MYLFWSLSLLLSVVGGILLTLYALPIKNTWIVKLSNALHRIWIPLLCCSGIYCLLIVQEVSIMTHQRENRKAGSSTESMLHYHSAGLFRSQRNLYIILIGLTIQVSLLILIWQTHSLSRKNQAIAQQLRDMQSERRD